MNKVMIVAVKNGVPQGYVKSVSYTKGSFKLSQDRLGAKRYTEDQAQCEIDTLMRWSMEQNLGYVFIYGR